MSGQAKSDQPLTADEFRAELVKIMPGYKWTIHRTTNATMEGEKG